ncbi:D-glycero-beta-D-manno-heptose 1-phosphate adenylyltransferase [Pinibacter aurantiacus]|uniref:D-glycero-beta-D-manno-heptose 1-phosphate adenylyltransferase n=1 Tax=Pinibacter aurantiacus TaxID=2851599 RepID=A0A9E2SBY9_9BACT|nr:D-glycero-beta-D-manno-heptose 1-phosphate adenylyltransferase [Pinibacter aurantiacus]MBV4358588.1 D-glycero-beta-D-manno-heptose 1-phosphate adenylyltransferase [Pinibacter aurantiacus]
MRNSDVIEKKIYEPIALEEQVYRWKFLGQKIAFTNGCFDILHKGHIASLSQAAKEADVLVVGLNSDASTKRLKGEGRPVNNERARATVLASLLMVDAVILFDEDTPLELIKKVMPDVIVKGGDYTLEQIVGAKEVMAHGGRVVINPIVGGYSTTGILGKIAAL